MDDDEGMGLVELLRARVFSWEDMKIMHAAANLIEQQEREIGQLKSARTLLMDELEEVRKVLR